jgi:hypothetical protein
MENSETYMKTTWEMSPTSWLTEPPYNWTQEEVNTYVKSIQDSIDEDIIKYMETWYPELCGEKSGEELS